MTNKHTIVEQFIDALTIDTLESHLDWDDGDEEKTVITVFDRWVIRVIMKDSNSFDSDMYVLRISTQDEGISWCLQTETALLDTPSSLRTLYKAAKSKAAEDDPLLDCMESYLAVHRSGRSSTASEFFA